MLRVVFRCGARVARPTSSICAGPITGTAVGGCDNGLDWRLVRDGQDSAERCGPCFRGTGRPSSRSLAKPRAARTCPAQFINSLEREETDAGSRVHYYCGLCASWRCHTNSDRSSKSLSRPARRPQQGHCRVRPLLAGGRCESRTIKFAPSESVHNISHCHFGRYA